MESPFYQNTFRYYIYRHYFFSSVITGRVAYNHRGLTVLSYIIIWAKIDVHGSFFAEREANEKKTTKKRCPVLNLSNRLLPPCAVEAFDFDFMVSAPPGLSGSFRIVTGGTGCVDYTADLSGLVSVPSTGGWDVFSLFASE